MLALASGLQLFASAHFFVETCIAPSEVLAARLPAEASGFALASDALLALSSVRVRATRIAATCSLDSGLLVTPSAEHSRGLSRLCALTPLLIEQIGAAI